MVHKKSEDLYLLSQNDTKLKMSKKSLISTPKRKIKQYFRILEKVRLYLLYEL